MDLCCMISRIQQRISIRSKSIWIHSTTKNLNPHTTSTMVISIRRTKHSSRRSRGIISDFTPKRMKSTQWVEFYISCSSGVNLSQGIEISRIKWRFLWTSSTFCRRCWIPKRNYVLRWLGLLRFLRKSCLLRIQAIHNYNRAFRAQLILKS